MVAGAASRVDYSGFATVGLTGNPVGPIPTISIAGNNQIAMRVRSDLLQDSGAHIRGQAKADRIRSVRDRAGTHAGEQLVGSLSDAPRRARVQLASVAGGQFQVDHVFGTVRRVMGLSKVTVSPPPEMEG